MPSSNNSVTDVDRAPAGPSGKEASASVDVESHAMAEAHLKNSTVRNISWSGVTVTVKDRDTKQPKVIVDNVEGIVEAGMCFRSDLSFLASPSSSSAGGVSGTGGVFCI